MTTSPSATPDPTSTPAADTSVDRRVLLGAAGLAGVAALGAIASRASAGPLSPPPGAVGATGKTLTEVEPRIAIPAGGAYTITQPGSYYLTGDISVSGGTGIFILCDHVTLDLNGYSVNGNGAASYGIACYFSGVSRRNVTIRNGTVRACAGTGVYCLDTTGGGAFHVENVTVIGCGGGIVLNGDGSVILRCSSIDSGYGLALGGSGGRVESSVVNGYSTAGVSVPSQSVVQGCVVEGAAANSTGISAGSRCRIVDCGAAGSLVGIQAGANASISGCSASGNTAFVVGVGSAVEACAASGYSVKGFQAGNASLLRGCSAAGDIGIGGTSGFATGSGCTLSECTANGNAIGFSMNAGTSVARCTGSGNVVGFDAPGVGLIVVECIAQGNSSDGFVISGNSTTRGCTASWNGGTGFKTGGSNARFEANTASNNSGRGFEIIAGGNFLSRNTASDNGTNWVVATGNICLIVSATVNAIPVNGNNGGAAPGSTDPNANFTF